VKRNLRYCLAHPLIHWSVDMKNLCSLLIVAVALIIGPCRLSAQIPTGTEKSLQGVWRIAEVISTNASAPSVRNPQPSQIIFTKTRYSYIAVNQPRPKLAPPANPSKLTDAEKIARYEHWALVTAHSGTYDVRGAVLTFRAAVAKNDAVMCGTERFEVKSEGEAIMLVSEENGYTLKLARLE
jgi:hypothetical protein